MADIFVEAIDIWPVRRRNFFDNFWQWIIIVRCNGDAVDDQPRIYNPNLPGHYVRIPVLMLHRPHRLPTQTHQQAVVNAFLNRIRDEPKSHAWVDPIHQELNSMKIDWSYREHSDSRELSFSNIASFHAVYPCFKEINGLPTMLMGVCFCRRTNHINTRSYLRYVDEVVNSRTAFDITENFISQDQNPGYPRHYTNGLLFERDYVFSVRNNIAFYVCRGARLIVGDERTPHRYAGAGRHNRALYQPGSLVVISGRRNLIFNARRQNGANWRFRFSKLYDQNRPCLYPAQRARRDLDDWELQRDDGPNLTTWKNQVIFLGVIESEFNSACWRISVNNNGDNNDYCLVYLDIPNEGIIEDIAPWNSGFELIRARQQYEQPWKAVTVYQDNTDVPEFLAPDEQYVLLRILGIHDGSEEHWGPLTIDYPYEEFDVPRPEELQPNESIDRYFVHHLGLRHFEYLSEWYLSPWNKVMQPPASPLLPPVKWYQNTFKYLDRMQRVRFWGLVNDEPAFIVDDYAGKYRLSHWDNYPGYMWEIWSKDAENQVIDLAKQQNIDYQNIDWNQWIRYSEDHDVYIKRPFVSNYNTTMVFLARIPEDIPIEYENMDPDFDGLNVENVEN